MDMYNRIRSRINRNVMRLIQKRFGDSLQTNKIMFTNNSFWEFLYI